MREVYANLKGGGIAGLMYDYPSTGWAVNGGFEDRGATTSSAYRNIFKVAREGLGETCYLHERNLGRGSDVTLGLVASQRVWGDNDRINPAMITRCEWEGKSAELRGKSKVIRGETYRVVIALNGYKPKEAKSGAARASVPLTGEKAGLAELTLDRPQNSDTDWAVTFSK
jgi:hypothetical protein